jgi:hypothetical protein
MSPTVFIKGGFSFRIYFPPLEHGPAHVHVEKDGMKASFWLADGSVRSVGKMRGADVTRAQQIVRSRIQQLQEVWRIYHEKD